MTDNQQHNIFCMNHDLCNHFAKVKDCKICDARAQDKVVDTEMLERKWSRYVPKRKD